MRSFLTEAIGRDVGRRGVSWRLMLVAVCVTALVVSACSPVASTAPGSASATSGPGTSGAAGPGGPTPGGTVITGISGDPPTLNPNLTTGISGLMVGCLVYQGLVRTTTDFEIEPLLASSWEISPDGLTYTFTLAEATWQDGQPFTSADVEYSLLNVNAKYGPAFAATGEAIETIETPDPRTVIVHLKHPFGPFLSTMDCEKNGAIVPKHLFEGTDVETNAASTTTPVGTGAYVLKEWVKNERLTFERNPNYWQDGLPYLDSIVLRVIPNGASRTLAFRAGELNQIRGYLLSQSDAPGLAEDGRYKLWSEGPRYPALAIFNTRNAPFDNKAVRQALFTAIDRDLVAANVFTDYGTPAKGAFSSIPWAHDPDLDLATLYPYDPEKAKQMLDQAGFPVGSDGFRFPMDLVFESTSTHNALHAEVLASMWREVGVNVNLVGLDDQTFTDRVYVQHDFDVVTNAHLNGGDPVGTHRVWLSTLTGPGQNASGFGSPELDAKFTEGASQATREERAAIYHEIEALLADELPTLTVIDFTPRAVAVKELNGLDLGLSTNSWWHTAWLATP